MWFAGRVFRIFFMSLAIAVVGSPTAYVLPVWASGDHDAAPRSISVAPRAETRIGGEEVVVIYAGGALLLFLHNYVDGVPTSRAEIELTVDFMPNALTEIAPGVYRSEPLTLAAGRNEIEMAYVIGEQSGSEVIPLTVPTNSKRVTTRSLPTTASGSVPGSVLTIIAVLLFAGVNLLLMRRARRA